MNRFRASVFFLLLALASQASEPHDSTAYASFRHSMYAESDSLTIRYIQAADELAELGMYTEAIELLNKAQPLKGPEAQRKVPPETSGLPLFPKKWSVSAGSDYFRAEDFGVADTLDPRVKDSLARIRETPLTIFSRATLEAGPTGPFHLTLVPSVTISNRDARMRLRSQLAFFDERIFVDFDAEGKKSIARWKDSLFVFVGRQPDSLDMLRGQGEIAVTNKRKLRALLYDLPLQIQVNHYRQASEGYRSFMEYSLRPMIEFTRNYQTSFGSQMDYRFKNYYQDGSMKEEVDSLDFHRLLLRSWVRTRKGGANGNLGFSYEHEYRPVGSHPKRRHIAAGGFRGRITRKSLSLGMNSGFTWTHETIGTEVQLQRDSIVRKELSGIVYYDTIKGTAAFREIQRSGFDLTLEPSADYSLTERFALGASVRYTRYKYPLTPLGSYAKITGSRFIRRSSDEIVPTATFRYVAPPVMIRLEPKAVFEFVSDSVYATDDSRGVGAEVSFDWAVLPWCTLYGDTDIFTKSYAPTNRPTSRATNLSFFLGTEITW